MTVVDLILRPRIVHIQDNPVQRYALQLRYHESLGETEYYDIASVPLNVAQEIVRAGPAIWLFGEPKETEE